MEKIIDINIIEEEVKDIKLQKKVGSNLYFVNFNNGDFLLIQKSGQTITTTICQENNLYVSKDTTSVFDIPYYIESALDGSSLYDIGDTMGQDILNSFVEGIADAIGQEFSQQYNDILKTSVYVSLIDIMYDVFTKPFIKNFTVVVKELEKELLV